MSKPHFTAFMQPVLSDLLSFEIDKVWSRESATLAPTTTSLPLGTVLQEGVSGLKVLTAEGTATAVLARNVEENDEPQPTLVFVRGCILKKDALQFSADYLDADKLEAIQELAAASILVR